MKGVNKVILIGNTGRSPTQGKNTTGDKQSAFFSLATTEVWKTSHGDHKEKTSWHNIVCWGNVAKYAVANINKGDCLYIEGKIAYYTQGGAGDTTGGNQKTEIVASQIKKIRSNKKGSQPPNEYDGLPF